MKTHDAFFSARRRPSGAGWIVFLLLALAPPVLSQAQSYQVLDERYVQWGNKWEFETSGSGSGSTLTWEFRNDGDGLYLRETGYGYYEDRTITLDQNAWSVTYSMEADYVTTPPLHYETKYSDAAEKIPRFVNVTDSQRQFGKAQGITRLLENDAYIWSRTQKSYVTYIGTERITVTAGTYSTIVFRVDETWQFSDGLKADVSRIFYMTPAIGPVKMKDTVKIYNEDGTLLSSSSATHSLKQFTTANPDIIATGGAFSPAVTRPGDTLYVSWAESSNYNDTEATHTAALYISVDSIIYYNDLLLTAPIRVGPISAGQSTTFAGSVTVPDLPTGQYYIGVIVDAWGEVAEYDEWNYFTFNGLLTIDNDPDLVAYGTVINPDWTEPGGYFWVGSAIMNWSPDPSPGSWMCIYLSADTVIDSNDVPVMEGFRSPYLGPYAWTDFIRIGTVPPNVPEGYYYVGVRVDVDNAIAERSETNNTAVLAQWLLVGRSDLYFVNGSYSPAGVVQGQTISVQTTVANAGITTAPGTWMLFYLSTDDQITTADFPIHTGLYVPAIPPGGWYTVVAQPQIPAYTPPGYYWVGAFYDVANTTVERVEWNNSGALAPGLLLVMAPPDLTIQGLDFAPQLVHEGESLQLTGSIINASGAPTDSGFWVEFFISPNPSFAPPQRMLCDSIYIPRLGIGESYSLAGAPRRVYDGLAPGVYTLGVMVDRLNQVAESNEANNLSRVTTKRLYINPRMANARKWTAYR